ncbi:MAG TPA: hypothetical protein VGH44_06015 [Candidatus Saccharimonadia bacterium]|jgi:hypothetical protein
MNPTGYVLAVDPLQHIIGQSSNLVFWLVVIAGALAIVFAIFAHGNRSRAFAIFGAAMLALVLVTDPHKVVNTFASILFAIF